MGVRLAGGCRAWRAWLRPFDGLIAAGCGHSWQAPAGPGLLDSALTGPHGTFKVVRAPATPAAARRRPRELRPGPVPRHPPARTDDPSGDVERPLQLGYPKLAAEQQRPRPGEQVLADQAQLEPDPRLRPNTAGGADPMRGFRPKRSLTRGRRVVCRPLHSEDRDCDEPRRDQALPGPPGSCGRRGTRAAVRDRLRRGAGRLCQGRVSPC